MKGFAILPGGGIELISSLIEQVAQHQYEAVSAELSLAVQLDAVILNNSSGDEAPSLRPHGSKSRE